MNAHLKFLEEQEDENDHGLRKPKTTVQQPTNGTLIDKTATDGRNVNIPSCEISQSDASPGIRTRASVQKRKSVPQEDLLAKHRVEYSNHCQKFKEEYTSRKWDIEGIVDQMKSTTIKCVKYNYSLDAGVQNFF